LAPSEAGVGPKYTDLWASNKQGVLEDEGAGRTVGARVVEDFGEVSKVVSLDATPIIKR